MSRNATRRKLQETHTVLSQFDSIGDAVAMTNKPIAVMPSIFIGHGSPMNALADTAYTRMLRQWGQDIGHPAAIVVVSAHWQTPGKTLVDIQLKPPTIHDFYNFPSELYQVQYPAMGAPDVAQMIIDAARVRAIIANAQWGLDHGTWAVLRHMFAQADIPVFQLSIDYDASGEIHYAIGKELAALREKGVLVVGSGNIAHNLRKLDFNAGDSTVASQPWAQEFDALVAQALMQRDDRALMDYGKFGQSAATAVATPDHYWPLLYVLVAADSHASADFKYDKFEAGTISMRCVQFGT